MKSELEFSGDMWFLDIWKAGGKYMIHRHLHGEITFYPCLFPTSRDKHMTFLLLCCCCKVASVVSDPVRPHRWQPTRLPRPWDSPGKNIGVGCHFLLQCRKVKVKVKSLRHVRLFETPWTAAYQAPPSMGVSRQEYWNGVPLPSPCLSLGLE